MVDVHETSVAALPDPKSKTVAPGVVEKPIPVIVTDVPPVLGPVLGLTALTVGALGGPNT